MIFEERIGCFNDPMPKQAAAFIENLVGFFRTMQPLMYNVPTYKIYEHRGWQVYERYTDALLSVGLDFVKKASDVIPNTVFCTICISCTTSQLLIRLSITRSQTNFFYKI